MRIEPTGAEMRFVDRLARENGWSGHHAAAVYQEYLRFLYLAGTSAGPLTPSDAVDQAWHLHLLYSRHYWEVLCGRILGGHSTTARPPAAAQPPPDIARLTGRRWSVTVRCSARSRQRRSGRRPTGALLASMCESIDRTA
jgi:hypothetical protein